MKNKLKEKEKKCVFCGKGKQYDSDGLCALCNYEKMLGIPKNNEK